MPQSVLKATSEDMNKIKSKYAHHLTDTLPPGALFQAKVPGCTITAYRSGKVLFQGQQAEAEASQFSHLKTADTKSKKHLMSQHIRLPLTLPPCQSSVQMR